MCKVGLLINIFKKFKVPYQEYTPFRHRLDVTAKLVANDIF